MKRDDRFNTTPSTMSVGSAGLSKPVRPRSGAAAPANGFTLIELLIAITILAVVAILAWRGLDQIVLGRQRVSQAMADERVIAQALDQIGSDTRAAATDDDAAGAPAIRVGDSVLQILRYRDLPDRAPRLQLIRYRLSDGQLLRLASPPLASAGDVRAALRAADRDGDDGWSRITLMRGVKTLESRAWIDGKGWNTSMAELELASRRSAGGLANPLNGGAPLFRTVTGVDVRLWMGTIVKPFVRVYPVGE
jgi:general secretion pathway protein J